MAKPTAPSGPRLAMSAREAAAEAGISRSKFYLLIESGELRAVKIGKRIVIKRTDFDAWWNALPSAEIGAAKKQ